jgi:hypothetical protein
MRKLVVLAIVLAAGTYLTGYLTLNQAGVTNLLADLEAMSTRGDVDGVCALFDDSVAVSLDDRTPEGPMKLTGGKPELCAYLSQMLPLQQKMVTATTIDRDHFTIARDWAHPLTARVAYREHRTVTFAPNVALGVPQTKMQSQDELTVVYTLQGRRITRLQSVSAALTGPEV